MRRMIFAFAFAFLIGLAPNAFAVTCPAGGPTSCATLSGDGTLAAGGALTVSAIGGKAVSLGAALTTTGTSATTLAFPSSGTPTYTFPSASKTLAANDWSNMGSMPTSGDLMLSAGNNAAPTAYGGTSCTNQALTALSATGGGTCNSITSAYISGSITAAQMLALATGDLYQGNGSNQPAAVTMSAAIDAAIGSTRGSILERGSSGWALITPGASGTVLTSGGTGADPSYQAGSTVGPPTALTDGSTIAVNAQSSNAPITFTDTLTQGCIPPSTTGCNVMLNPTNPTVGQELVFLISEPPSGGPYDLCWGTAYGWEAGGVAKSGCGVGSYGPTITQIPGATTEIDCRTVSTAPTLICSGPYSSDFEERTIQSSPTAPYSTSAYTLQGLNNGIWMLSPHSTGNYAVTITGTVTSTVTTAGDGISGQIYYGIGVGAPNGYGPSCPGGAPQTATFAGGGSSNITLASTAIAIGCQVNFVNSGGALPSCVTAGTNYFVVSLSTLTITISSTVGGSAITCSSAGTGTQTAQGVNFAGIEVGLPQVLWENPTTVTAADVGGTFAVHGHLSGLVPSNVYWVDLATEAIGAKGFGVKNLVIDAEEIR